jgi:hypothetical protein
MVRSRRLELPRPFGHSDLNAARLPVPPRPHVHEDGRLWCRRSGKARASIKALGRAQCRALRSLVDTVLNALFAIGPAKRYGWREVDDGWREVDDSPSWAAIHEPSGSNFPEPSASQRQGDGGIRAARRDFHLGAVEGCASTRRKRPGRWSNGPGMNQSA